MKILHQGGNQEGDAGLRIEVRSYSDAKWPFTVPAIRAHAQRGLDFERPVTFLVGENGTGKSTIVEAS